MRTVTTLLISLLFAAELAAYPQGRDSDATGQNTGPLRVAVATNFTSTLHALADLYASASGVRLRISSASTGVHYTQIRQGAPFDVLLAADSERPARLVADGLALTDSRMVYAIGRLVLLYPGKLSGESLAALLDRPDMSLAIANPELAPYGRAARDLLARFPAANPRVLTGQNVGQASQMWVAGGADLALVSASFALEPSLAVPADWHSPIEQEAVVLAASSQKPRAQQFLDWLAGPVAREIIQQHHYDLPEVSRD